MHAVAVRVNQFKQPNLLLRLSDISVNNRLSSVVCHLNHHCTIVLLLTSPFTTVYKHIAPLKEIDLSSELGPMFGHMVILSQSSATKRLYHIKKQNVILYLSNISANNGLTSVVFHEIAIVRSLDYLHHPLL